MVNNQISVLVVASSSSKIHSTAWVFLWMKHLQLGIAWAVGEKWLILKRETLEVAALDVNSNGKLPLIKTFGGFGSGHYVSIIFS